MGVGLSLGEDHGPGGAGVGGGGRVVVVGERRGLRFYKKRLDCKKYITIPCNLHDHIRGVAQDMNCHTR